jgi:hypothetical protein
MRFAKPALGLQGGSKVFPVSPCQVFLSFYDSEDRYREGESLKTLAISAFDPHTTTKKSRSCLECHGDSKVLGLGEGILGVVDGRRTFRATYDAAASGLGISFPLDGYLSASGEALQRNPLTGTRPFSKEEVDQILWVNACVGCHGGYDDPIYQDFESSKRRFQQKMGLPCLN